MCLSVFLLVRCKKWPTSDMFWTWLCHLINAPKLFNRMSSSQQILLPMLVNVIPRLNPPTQLITHKLLFAANCWLSAKNLHSFCNLKKIYNEHQQEVLTEWPPEYFQKSYKAIHVYRSQELISFSSHSTSTQALRTFVREMNLSCCWSCFLEMINKTESDLKDVSLLQGTLMTKSGC